jgi:hypothetical protein
MSNRNASRTGRIRMPQPVPQPGAAKVFPDFPYNRKFTHAEIHEDILPRAERLGAAMRDGVGPSGSVLYIPGDMFEQWMVHGALAGVDVDESKAYIRARRLPDQTGRLAGAVEWVLKQDETPEARAADAEREAAAHLEAMERMMGTLRPEVRSAIRRRMRGPAQEGAEYVADDPDGAHRRAEPRDFGAPRLVEIRPEDQEQP